MPTWYAFCALMTCADRVLCDVQTCATDTGNIAAVFNAVKVRARASDSLLIIRLRVL